MKRPLLIAIAVCSILGLANSAVSDGHLHYRFPHSDISTSLTGTKVRIAEDPPRMTYLSPSVLVLFPELAGDKDASDAVATLSLRDLLNTPQDPDTHLSRFDGESLLLTTTEAFASRVQKLTRLTAVPSNAVRLATDAESSPVISLTLTFDRNASMPPDDDVLRTGFQVIKRYDAGRILAIEPTNKRVTRQSILQLLKSVARFPVVALTIDASADLDSSDNSFNSDVILALPSQLTGVAAFRSDHKLTGRGVRICVIDSGFHLPSELAQAAKAPYSEPGCDWQDDDLPEKPCGHGGLLLNS